MTTPRRHAAIRMLSGLMAFLIGFGPITPLFAATPLADGPINVSIRAHPNIVFTLDDSTSMLLAFLPDYVVVNPDNTTTGVQWCRSNTGVQACGAVGTTTVPQYDYATWLAGALGGAGFPYPSGYGNNSYGPPIVMTSSFNAMFYNPAVTYTAPLKYNKTSFADMNATNTTNWTKVPADPFLYPTKFVNLQTKINVGIWCNSTYGGNFTSPSGTAADRDLANLSGDYCRINGYAYAKGSNDAPATKGDYSYPFSDNVTAKLSAPYFATTTRTLYCDPNKMNVTWTDPPSTTTTSKPSVAPTCVACAQTCPVAQVEDPASPAGCELGCTNPAECTKCNLKCPVALVYTGCSPATCAKINDKVCADGTYAGQPAKTCDTATGLKCQAGSAAVCGATTDPPPTASGVATGCTTVISGITKLNQTLATTTIPAGTIGKTYEQDANSNGDVCRRNNFSGTYTAGSWTYPSGAYTQVTGSCGGITASINRHYYKAMVQWCDTQIATGSSNDKWRGFGKGTCQAEKTDTYKWPRFFKAGAYADAAFATEQDNTGDNTAFELVELDFKNKKIIVAGGSATESITHTLVNGDTITRNSTGTTPVASELVNYANWFAYYRTRILAAKTVTSLAFSELTDKFRVGFHTLSNNPGSTFLTLDDFKGDAGLQRDLWYRRIVGLPADGGITIPMGNDTPLLNAVARIGEWFEASSGTHAALSGSKDPINLSCQKNYHIVFTDGYTNQVAQTTGLPGNIDGAAIPTLPEEILELPPGGEWPKKIKEGSTAVTDSLSDYTLKYWLTDMRPGTMDAKVADNNVPSTENDPAKWQHLNFAALSLGTQGVLPSMNPKNTEAQIAAGSVTWPAPNPVNRPGTAGVDDLWHAAVAGRSQFVNARDPQELQTGMASILQEIKNLQAARAGAAFSSVNFTKDNNYVYRVTIEPGWGGTLTKVLVDSKGGGEVSIGTKYHEVLAAQVTPSAGNTTPWYDKRNVVTWDPTAGKAVPFRLGKMPTSQSDTLGADDTAREKVIAYLRGDRSNEGTALKNYRVRSQVLGDIVSSSPVVVGDAWQQYSNATDPGYEDHKAAVAGRKKMVYVGSNDGMLHAFDESTGAETWAYVPSFMYSSATDKGLAMLAKKEPFFKHQMFVDSTPIVAEVDIGGTWKTILVGGLGKGGKGYYAIDITNPGSITSEDEAAKKVLWEFTDSEMGYSYGQPLIAKTYKDGWVAIFASGYDATGKAKLYVVSLATGKEIRRIETSVAGEAGLAQLAGFVLTFRNQVLEQIYGGDLLGNVWRFDVSSSTVSDWKAVKLAELTSTDGTAQSVTIRPEIEVDLANGVDRYLMIGTGRLLHEDDLTTYGNQVQTMYVIRDGVALKMNTADLPYKPRTDADFTSVSSTDTAGFSANSVKGWYQDLPKGERIIAPISAELNVLAWAGSLPPENECLPGLAANVYVKDFVHAESLLIDPETKGIVASVSVKEGVVGGELINSYTGEPNTPALRFAITLGTDGKVMFVDITPPKGIGAHRMSWRLLGH